MESIINLMEEFESGLKLEIECFKKLEELTNAQEEVIKKGNISALFDILSQKNRYLEKYNSIDENLKKHKEIWEKNKMHLPENIRQNIDKCIEELSSIAKRCIEKEENQQKKVSEMKEKTKKDLANFNKTRYIHNAYTKVFRSPGGIFDGEG